MAIDLHAYLTRIGYDGYPAATLETLKAIQGLHTASIPFENLDPFLGRPVHLDDDTLGAKLLRSARGGYCFEHNLLLSSVLREIGFDVTGLEARVLHHGAQKRTPRGHMLLLVRCEHDSWLVDVGFGGPTPRAPLRLTTEAVQDGVPLRFRIAGADTDYCLGAELEDGWTELYAFDLQPQDRADYEVTNWYLSTHPRSPFVQHLMVALSGPRVRHALFNDRLTTFEMGRTARQVTLRTAADLVMTLRSTFGINLSEDADLKGVFDRIARGPRPASRTQHGTS